jgi:hypothetical protein
MLPVLAESRMLYASKHRSRLGAFLERAGLACEAGTHALVSTLGPATRRGHARALQRVIAGPRLI